MCAKYHCFCLTLVLVFVAGCGNSNAKKQFKLSGTVTYKDKPVPAGALMLEPDYSKGNNGFGAMTEIKNGRYETRPNKGIVGGYYIVKITGHDGIPAVIDGEKAPIGRRIFADFRTKVQLPNEDTVKDFRVE